MKVKTTRAVKVCLESSIGLVALVVLAWGQLLGQAGGDKIVPVFSIEPNVISGGSESTVSITIGNANPNSTQAFHTGETYRITLHQPGIKIVHVDPVAVIRSMNLAPADFQIGFASATELVVQYVGPIKCFKAAIRLGRS